MGLHPCGLFRFQMVMAYQVEDAVDNQQGQLLVNGPMQRQGLPAGLRIGDDNLAQGRQFIGWQDKVGPVVRRKGW